MSILNAPEGLLKMLILKYEIPIEVEVSKDWDKRKAICDGCPSSFNKAVGLVPNSVKVCRECGCLIEAKVLIKLESCPLGKW